MIAFAPARALGLFTAIALCSAAPSQAENHKLYPGSMCVRYSGTTFPSLRYSAIGNPSDNTWMYIDCPVINDEHSTRINRGWVRVVDENPKHNHDVSCQLYSVYRNGPNIIGWVAPRMSSKNAAAYDQILVSDGVGANGTSHYYYSCNIPPQYSNRTSYVTSYLAIEE